MELTNFSMLADSNAVNHGDQMIQDFTTAFPTDITNSTAAAWTSSADLGEFMTTLDLDIIGSFFSHPENEQNQATDAVLSGFLR